MIIIFCVRTADGNFGPFKFHKDAYEFAKRHGDPASLITAFTDDWDDWSLETEQRQRRRSRRSSENTP